MTSTAAPLAVTAPAGSGKTRVLTARVAHRIATGTAEAEHVLCVTFTRKAGDELRARLRALGIRDHIEAGTFHSVAWRQLRDRWHAAGRAAPGLLDRTRPFLARHVVPDASPGTVAELANAISWARARRIAPERYADAARSAGRRTRQPATRIADGYRAYTEEKARRHVVDFDDLLAACAAAIEGDPSFAAAQRWRFRHLFVDEFQDVNPLQFRLLEAWRGDRSDVFVVGDAHQSIYGWNGSEPGLLGALEQRWPALETIALQRTHRSTPQITAAAAAVVRSAGLDERHPTSTGEPGPVPAVHEHADELAEVSELATLLRRRRGPDVPWRAMAVLARTQEQVREVERGLGACGVPAALTRPTGLLDDRDVGRVLAALRIDDRPLAVALADALDATPTPGSPLAEVLDAADGHVETDTAATGRSFAGWASAHLGGDQTADCVTVATIHAAKGLEWPVVHVVGCEEGYLPISTARRPHAVDEEARLLYVAITRAERELHLHWARRRTVRRAELERERSRFLDGFEAAVAATSTPAPDDDAGRTRIAAMRTSVGEPAPPDPLVQQLLDWREARARASRVDPEIILSTDDVRTVARSRPADLDALGAVGVFGTARLRRYGDELLAVVAAAPPAEPRGRERR